MPNTQHEAAMREEVRLERLVSDEEREAVVHGFRAGRAFAHQQADAARSGEAEGDGAEPSETREAQYNAIVRLQGELAAAQSERDAGQPVVGRRRGDATRAEREERAVIAVEDDWQERYRCAVPTEAWELAVKAGYDACLKGQTERPSTTPSDIERNTYTADRALGLHTARLVEQDQPVDRTCPTCGGDGGDLDDSTKNCDECDGSGSITDGGPYRRASVEDQPVDRAETPQEQWARESNEHQIAHEAAEHPETGERNRLVARKTDDGIQVTFEDPEPLQDGGPESLHPLLEALRQKSEPLQDGGERPETWMVDYEHGDGEPQHAVLSWLDDEAKDLPEVGTQLVRKSDYDALKNGPASYEGVTRMLREVQEERDDLRLRARRAEEGLGHCDFPKRHVGRHGRQVRGCAEHGHPRCSKCFCLEPLSAEHPHQDVEALREDADEAGRLPITAPSTQALQPGSWPGAEDVANFADAALAPSPDDRPKPTVTHKQIEQAARAIQDYPESEEPKGQPLIPRSIKLAENGFRAAGFSLPDDRGGERVTHGRHCPCSACAAQDWTEPQLAPCGMHGPGCPPVYAPVERVPEAVQAGTCECDLGECTCGRLRTPQSRETSE